MTTSHACFVSALSSAAGVVTRSLVTTKPERSSSRTTSSESATDSSTSSTVSGALKERVIGPGCVSDVTIGLTAMSSRDLRPLELAAGLHQQRAQLGCRDRPADQVTLQLVTLEETQELELLMRLYTLRHRLEVEGARETDDSRDDCHISRIGRQAVDERTVDLERIDSQA